MTADPLRKPVTGEPFIPSARREGMVIDALLDTQGRAPGNNPKIGDDDAGTVFVQNTLGDLTADRPIIGLGDPLITPTDRPGVVHDRPAFEGAAPSADGKFAVYLGPTPNNVVARAVTSGVVWVRVDVLDESHQYCTASGSTSALVSSESGAGYILATEEGGTGEQWALVRLSNPADAGAATGSGSGSGDGGSGDGSGGSGDGSGATGGGNVKPGPDGCPDGYTMTYKQIRPSVTCPSCNGSGSGSGSGSDNGLEPGPCPTCGGTGSGSGSGSGSGGGGICDCVVTCEPTDTLACIIGCDADGNPIFADITDDGCIDCDDPDVGGDDDLNDGNCSTCAGSIQGGVTAEITDATCACLIGKTQDMERISTNQWGTGGGFGMALDCSAGFDLNGTLECDADTWKWTWGGCTVASAVPADDGWTCSPLVITFTDVLIPASGCGDCDGKTATIVVTL